MCRDIWYLLRRTNLPTEPKRFKYALQDKNRYNDILRHYNDRMKANPNWIHVREILLRCNMAVDLIDKIKEIEQDFTFQEERKEKFHDCDEEEEEEEDVNSNLQGFVI